MKLKLVRKTGTAEFTEGKLYVDEVFECYTVEDAVRAVKVQNKTAIPKGIYPVTITMSNRFKKNLPLLAGVPDFTGVRIHAGNSSKDTEGCIIVGSINDREDDDWVSGSKVAMDRLQPKIAKALKAGKTVTIEVV